MSQEFFQTIEERYSDRNFKEKWSQKCTTFFDNFSYLNSEDLIEDQILKLTHVGINSIGLSGTLIEQMTNENMQVMQEQLHVIIKDMGTLTTKFEILEKSIKQKTGLFSSKTSSEIFFETFKKEEKTIRTQINELKLKSHNLIDVKSNLEQGIDKLIDCYALLERDVRFLKQTQEALGNNEKKLIKDVYQKHLFEITNIRSDLLTHQQIIFQKIAAIKILLQNVMNCTKNINFVSTVTLNAIMNVIELQQIISMGQSRLDDKQTQALLKAKDALLVVTTDLRLIAATPFAAHSG